MVTEYQNEILKTRNLEKKTEEEMRIKKYFDKKNLFLALIQAIKNKDELLISELTNKISKDKLSDFIWKLERYKYKVLPYTKLAINQLKHRKGF